MSYDSGTTTQETYKHAEEENFKMDSSDTASHSQGQGSVGSICDQDNDEQSHLIESGVVYLPPENSPLCVPTLHNPRYVDRLIISFTWSIQDIA
jgi:hypothetical protein